MIISANKCLLEISAFVNLCLKWRPLFATATETIWGTGLYERMREENGLEYYIMPSYSSIATKLQRQRTFTAWCFTLRQETSQPAMSSCWKPSGFFSMAILWAELPQYGARNRFNYEVGCLAGRCVRARQRLHAAWRRGDLWPVKWFATCRPCQKVPLCCGGSAGMPLRIP